MGDVYKANFYTVPIFLEAEAGCIAETWGFGKEPHLGLNSSFDTLDQLFNLSEFPLCKMEVKLHNSQRCLGD